MQVLHCEDSIAVCTRGDDTDRNEHVDISLVGRQPKGTWLLVFLGAAREVMTAQQANDTLNALEAVEQVMAGESTASSIDALFADLVTREPYLPEHLRDAVDPSHKKESKA